MIKMINVPSISHRRDRFHVIMRTSLIPAHVSVAFSSPLGSDLLYICPCMESASMDGGHHAAAATTLPCCAVLRPIRPKDSIFFLKLYINLE